MREPNSSFVPQINADTGLLETSEEAKERVQKQQEAAARSEDRSFRSNQVKTNKILVGANIVLSLCTAAALIIAIPQSRSANRSARAAERSAKISEDTLNEMKTGSGARDTHDLAVQAERQSFATGQLAEATRALVLSSKQQNAIGDRLARLADRQVTIAADAESLSEAMNLANVSVEHLDLTKPLTANTAVPILNNFVNSGSSTAFGVQILSASEFRLAGVSPDYTFKRLTGSKFDLAAKNYADVTMVLPPQSPAIVQAVASGRATFYIVGLITFSDAKGAEHSKTFCLQLEPNTTRFVGCEDQGPTNGQQVTVTH